MQHGFIFRVTFGYCFGKVDKNHRKSTFRLGLECGGKEQFHFSLTPVWRWIPASVPGFRSLVPWTGTDVRTFLTFAHLVVTAFDAQ